MSPRAPCSHYLAFAQAHAITVDLPGLDVMDTNLHRKRNPIGNSATLAEPGDWVMTVETLIWQQDG